VSKGILTADQGSNVLYIASHFTQFMPID